MTPTARCFFSEITLTVYLFIFKLIPIVFDRPVSFLEYIFFVTVQTSFLNSANLLFRSAAECLSCPISFMISLSLQALISKISDSDFFRLGNKCWIDVIC